MPQKIARTLVGELKNFPAWLYGLIALTVFGFGVGVYRLVVGLGAATNLNQGYPWGLWIGFDLFVVAFSGGALHLPRSSMFFKCTSSTRRRAQPC